MACGRGKKSFLETELVGDGTSDSSAGGALGCLQSKRGLLARTLVVAPPPLENNFGSSVLWADKELSP